VFWLCVTLEIIVSFGLCPSFGILKTTTFRKPDLFPSSGEGLGDICFVGSVTNEVLRSTSGHGKTIARCQEARHLGRAGYSCRRNLTVSVYNMLGPYYSQLNIHTKNSVRNVPLALVLSNPAFSYLCNRPSRLPHFLHNRLTDGAEVVSLTRRPATLYPHEVSWYSFLLEAESNPGL
jgi:hypothetical protein